MPSNSPTSTGFTSPSTSASGFAAENRAESLIVTGTIGIDTVYTPHGHRERVLGGSCTYFAAAASFHTPVRMVAAVGGDFPDAFRGMMARFERIDTRGLQVRPQSKTFAWGGRYHDNMNSRETLFTELGVLAEAAPVIPDVYRDSGCIFLANTHPSVQLQMLDALPERKLVVADTMDLWINVAREDLEALLLRVDGLVLNYDEAELLTGKSNTVTAARRILAMGPSFVVVKKGEHGCIVVHHDGIAALPAFPTETVIDPTGAGDSFAGGMMGYLAAGAGVTGATGGGAGTGERGALSFNNLRQALAHGTVMASFTIESFSLERLMNLTHAELAARYEEFVSMVRV